MLSIFKTCSLPPVCWWNPGGFLSSYHRAKVDTLRVLSAGWKGPDILRKRKSMASEMSSLLSSQMGTAYPNVSTELATRWRRSFSFIILEIYVSHLDVTLSPCCTMKSMAHFHPQTRCLHKKSILNYVLLSPCHSIFKAVDNRMRSLPLEVWNFDNPFLVQPFHGKEKATCVSICHDWSRIRWRTF